MLAIPASLPWDESEVFPRLNPATGLVELIHIDSGEVVALAGELHDLRRAPVDFTQIDTPEGKLLIQKGIPIEHIQRRGSAIAYSPMMAALVCEAIATGGLISKLPAGFPSPALLYLWQRRHPEFSDMITKAYEHRAEYYADQATQVADSLKVGQHDSEDASVARAKMDQYNRNAASGNQRRYGSQTKVHQEVSGKVSFTIETGIRRDSDPNFFVDETRKIREANDSGE